MVIYFLSILSNSSLHEHRNNFRICNFNILVKEFLESFTTTISYTCSILWNISNDYIARYLR